MISGPSAGSGPSRVSSGDDGRFPKSARLIKTGEFRKVYKSGRSFYDGGVTMKTLANDLGAARIGFSISSGNIKKACRRNRVRRLFREAFRRNRKNLKQDLDIVFIIKKDTARDFSYADAETVFLRLAKKAQALA
jgi:ribonuclease P protein component